MQTYISIEEFNDFKTMMEEKFEQMGNTLIHADEKMENLTEMMIDGFDMVYDKLEG